MKMTHTITNISSEPFSNPHVRKIIDRIMNEVMYNTCGNATVCDPFARESFTNTLPNCITNDLNTAFNTDFNLEFKDFAEVLQGSHHTIDLLLFDPPYSLRQLKDCYDGIGKDLKLWQTQNMWKEGKDKLATIMPVGSYAISLGWTTSGFGKGRGFEKKEVHVFEQSAREDRYSMLLTVERKVQHSLNDYPMQIESE
jgi:hypothetical protein